jgi:uncharacterized repeat protein (TIGR01451 family)
MKKVFSLLILGTCFLLLTTNVLADTTYGGYGGAPPSSSMMVIKRVGRPIITKGGGVVCDSSVTYVDNFTTSDKRFQANENICFQITIQNTSNITINDIVFTDTIPSYLTPIAGPGVIQNGNTNQISFDASSFASSQQKIYYVLMQVVGADKLPNNIVCQVNRVDINGSDNAVSDSATSQFCIEKTMITSTPTSVPATGPELGPLLLSSEIIMLGIGILLRKRI